MAERRSGRVRNAPKTLAQEQAAAAEAAEAKKTATKKTAAKKPPQKKTTQKPAAKKAAAKPKAKKTTAPKSTAKAGSKRKKDDAEPQEESSTDEEQPPPKKTRAKKTAAPKPETKADNKRKKAQADPEDDAVTDDQPPKKRAREDNNGEQVEAREESASVEEPPSQHEQPPARTEDAENQEDVPAAEYAPATPAAGTAGAQLATTDHGTPLLDMAVIQGYLDSRMARPQSAAAHQDAPNEATNDDSTTNDSTTNEVQTNDNTTNEVPTNEVPTNDVPTNEVTTNEATTSADAAFLASAAATAARQSPPKFGQDWRTGTAIERARTPPVSFTSPGDEWDLANDAAYQRFRQRRPIPAAMDNDDAEDDEDAENGEEEGADDEADDDGEEDGDEDGDEDEEEYGEGDGGNHGSDGSGRHEPEREPSPGSTHNADPDDVVHTGTNTMTEATEQQGATGESSVDAADVGAQDITAAQGGSESNDATGNEIPDQADDDALARMLQAELDQATGDEQGQTSTEAQGTTPDAEETSEAMNNDEQNAHAGDRISAPAADTTPPIPTATESNTPRASTEPNETTERTQSSETALTTSPAALTEATQSRQRTSPTRSNYRTHHSDMTRPPPPFDYYDPNRRRPRHQRSPENRALRVETEDIIDARGYKWSPDLSSPEYEQREAKRRADRVKKRRERHSDLSSPEFEAMEARRRAGRVERQRARQQQQGAASQAAGVSPVQPSNTVTPAAEPSGSQATSDQAPAPQPPSTPEIGPAPSFPEPTTDDIARFGGDLAAAAAAEPPASPSPPTSIPPPTSPPASLPPPSASSQTFKRPGLRKKSAGSTASSRQNSPTGEGFPRSPSGLAHDEGQTQGTGRTRAGPRLPSFAQTLGNVGRGTFRGPPQETQSRPTFTAPPRESHVGPAVPPPAPPPTAENPFAPLLAEQNLTPDGEQTTAQPAAERPRYVPQVGDDETTLEAEAAAARNTTRPGSADPPRPQRPASQANDRPYAPQRPTLGRTDRPYAPQRPGFQPSAGAHTSHRPTLPSDHSPYAPRNTGYGIIHECYIPARPAHDPDHRPDAPERRPLPSELPPRSTRPHASGTRGRGAAQTQAPRQRYTNTDDELDPLGVHPEYAGDDNPDEFLNSLPGLTPLGPDEGWPEDGRELPDELDPLGSQARGPGSGYPDEFLASLGVRPLGPDEGWPEDGRELPEDDDYERPADDENDDDLYGQ